MAKQNIVVVGAGIAGLTAAYFLKQQGCDPVVLEKSERVGGRMVSDVVDGFTIDGGAQFLTSGYALLTDLVDRLGLGSELVEISPYVGVVRKGKIRKISSKDLFSPLRAGLLSFPGWLRLGFLNYRLASRIASLPINDISAWSEYDDVDGETWSNSYFGPEITDFINEPPFDGFYYQPMSHTSRVVPMVTTHQLFHVRVKYRTLTGGIEVLPKRLASELNVRLNCPVRSMSVDKAGIELDTGNERIKADRVILATTSSVSSVLHKEPTGIERELLANPYSSTIVIGLGVKDSFRVAPEIEDMYGFFIPKRERNVISAVADEGNKDKRRLAQGKLFTIFLSGKAGTEMFNSKDGDILRVVLQEMEKYYTGISENVLFAKYYRWREAVPMTPVGRSRKVAQYRGSIGRSTRVFLAGDYMSMPYTEGAAESGRWAADALIRSLQQPSAWQAG